MKSNLVIFRDADGGYGLKSEKSGTVVVPAIYKRITENKDGWMITDEKRKRQLSEALIPILFSFRRLPNGNWEKINAA